MLSWLRRGVRSDPVQACPRQLEPRRGCSRETDELRHSRTLGASSKASGRDRSRRVSIAWRRGAPARTRCTLDELHHDMLAYVEVLRFATPQRDRREAGLTGLISMAAKNRVSACVHVREGRRCAAVLRQVSRLRSNERDRIRPKGGEAGFGPASPAL